MGPHGAPERLRCSHYDRKPGMREGSSGLKDREGDDDLGLVGATQN